MLNWEGLERKRSWAVLKKKDILEYFWKVAGKKRLTTGKIVFQLRFEKISTRIQNTETSEPTSTAKSS